MFKHFFFSELRYTLKQPMVYIFSLIVTLLVFGATSSDNVQIGGAVGNVYRNSPNVITTYTLVISIFGLLFAAAFFNNAALRDYKNDFQEIMFTTPISRFSYFFGRFFGALFLSTIPLLGVFFGILYGSQVAPIAGWVEADRFGPFFLETFVNNYLIFILPNMFFAGAVIFALSNHFKNTVISFVGALIIIIAYTVSGQLLSDIDNETIGALTDTFGIRTYSIVSKYYTPIEKNTLSPSMTGLLLYNRLIWIGLGLLILSLSYLRFSFQEKNKRVKKVKNKTFAIEKNESLVVPKITSFGTSNFQQFSSFFKENFLNIFQHVTFKILFFFSIILLLSQVLAGYDYFGLKSYPVTYQMMESVSGGTGLFMIIIIVFFSGELVWRDRDVKINEVVDATPHLSIVPLFAKTLSLLSLVFILHFFFIFLAIVYQLIMGYTRIEFGVYLLDFFLDSFGLYTAMCFLMVAVQVLVNHKYLGYFVSILFIFVVDIILLIADVNSNMLSFGGGPFLVYSDINGFGPGVTGSLWFSAYWILFAMALLFLSGVVWNRGSKKGFIERFQNRESNVTKKYRWMVMGSIAVWVLVAGFVYYNTQVLNPYSRSKVLEKRAVTYEEQYKKYTNAPQPKITKADYSVDIYPNKGKVAAKVVFQMKNETAEPIDSLFLNVRKSANQEIDFPNAKEVFYDEDNGFKIYQVDPPFAPGDSVTTTITSSFSRKGFSNGTGATSVVKNGSFFNNFQMLPSFGYSADKELGDKNKRKKYGLPKKDRMPKLEEDCGAPCEKNYLTGGFSDYIDVETVISTTSDQTAIAPGSLIETWEEEGRTYFRYRVDHPSQHFMSFLSARYQIAKRQWKDVGIEIYYEPKHEVNIEMMLDAVERSLEYYTENFGPYKHKQCRIIEFPRYATFAQAFPGTMPYSESFGFIIDLEDVEGNNVVDAVIAHEMAHQWWAHQLVGADMQGGTMLSESFSEYASLMTMKSIADSPMKMREFLKYDHDRYLRGRAFELEKELPLYKVENQQYIHYGKGSVILYALQDYIGEEKVNAALSEFLAVYRYKAPYPTSLDFLDFLEPKVPDSLNYLVQDWFKEITLYDNRLKEATAIKTSNGKYKVSFEIEAAKIKADSLGKERKVALNEWIDLGVFGDEEEKKLLFQKRVAITDSLMTFEFEVDSLPVKAAIDPRHILIDRVYTDNIKKIRLDETE